MKRALLISSLLLLFTGLGSVNQLAIVPYVVLTFAIAFIVLVALGKIKDNIPIYIYALSLAMIWQNTMLGTYVVGNDIQRELLLAREAYTNGWDPANYAVYMSNSSVVIGILSPFLSRVLHMDLVWVFKAIMPLFLAGVPVVLYYAFKKQFDAKVAVYAVIFFISVPVLTMEISTIVKSMVAELFLALMILTVVSNLSNTKKTFAIFGCLMGMLFSHYTVAIIAVMYLIGMLVMSSLGLINRIREYIGVRKIVVWSTSVALVVTLGIGYIYYNNVGNGAVIQSIIRIGGWVGDAPKNMAIVDDTGAIDYTPPVSTYLSKQPELVRAGIGLDFIDSTTMGKLFRVLQYITQILILIGAVYIIKNRKRYNLSAEFTAGIIGSFIMLLMCIVVPNFSRIINMTRFYHLSLFFLAPLMIIALSQLAKTRFAVMMSSLLVAYMLFTSGFVFEVTRSNVIDRLDTPYNFALSANRTGLAGIYTENDLLAVDYIKKRDNLVSGDTNGILLCSSYIEALPRLKDEETGFRYDMADLPDNCLVFLTEWNTQNNKLVSPVHVGTRYYRDIPDDIGDLVYQVGDAKVYLWISKT